MNTRERSKLILQELEKVMNLNYNLEDSYLAAIERGLRAENKETPVVDATRESSN